MTKEDKEKAIRELKRLKEEYWDDDGYGHETKQYDDTMFALDMAIKLLERQPREDAVSRSDVITLIMNLNYKYLFNVVRGISQKAFEDLLNGAQALPSVRPAVCIATVKFNKEDMQKIVDEKVKELKTMTCDRATSSIKKEPALDKIKDEIEQSYCTVISEYDRGRNYGLYMATQIIDKYKTESED